MADPSPEIVEKKLREGELDEKAAVALLVSYIENSEIEAERLKSIEILNRIPLIDDIHFKFLEELVISDSNIVIQGYAASILINNFLDKGLDSIKWLIKQKHSPTLLSRVLNSLLKSDKGILRDFIIKEFNTVLSGQIKFVKLHFEPLMKALVSNYREFFERTPFESIATENLMEIFLGYYTLVFIGDYYDLFYELGFDLKDGYVTGLRIEGSGSGKWNRPTDIDGLVNFPKLEELTLKMGQFKEIGILDNFSNLKILDLSECFISKIENLENLTKLEHLSLAFNQVEEIKNLEKLSKLKSLLLSGNQISNIEGLSELSNLVHLILSENHIEEIKGLDTLQDLEWLYLDNNRIKELKGLEKLHNLEILGLNGNKITKITEIENLVNLRELDISNNRIRKIEGISSFNKLRRLSLYNNKIEILEGIKDLTSLEILSLSNNIISEVRDLELIDPSVYIFLSNNNLSESLIKTIKELEKKKKNINYLLLFT